MKVKINNYIGKHFFLKERVPQRSSISPLFFIIYLNDIGERLNTTTSLSVFADDTAICINNKDHKDPKEEIKKGGKRDRQLGPRMENEDQPQQE